MEKFLFIYLHTSVRILLHHDYKIRLSILWKQSRFQKSASFLRFRPIFTWRCWTFWCHAVRVAIFSSFPQGSVRVPLIITKMCIDHSSYTFVLMTWVCSFLGDFTVAFTVCVMVNLQSSGDD